jgi:nucleoid DNA-binding protein
MESFAEIISRLLLRHNCVIIPDFGGFVARTSPSEIDEIRGIIHPPKKSILFNQQLTISDGLLISEYAIANHFSFTESQEKIKQIISLWKEELKEGKTITLEKVGTLQYGENDSLQFVQDRFFNLLLSSFGLSTVKFVPVVTDKKELISEVVHEESEKKKTLLEKVEDEVDISIIQHPATKKRTSGWKIALAAACFLPIAFYSYWIPVQTTVFESGIFATQDFNPFSKAKESKYKQTTISRGDNLFEDKGLEDQISLLDPSAESFSYEWDETTFYTIPLNNKVNISNPAPEVSQPPNVTTVNGNSQTPSTHVIIHPTANVNSDISFAGVKSGKKYAIVGCFSEVANAKNYVQELNNKGFNASFLDYSKGLYRISIEESTSIDSLQPTIQKASNLGYNTWILK